MPHNSKCRYGERGAADAKPKAQIILDAAKVSAASGGYSEPKQGQRSQSARGFCPRSTMRVPQPDIGEHFGNADAVPQPPERCLSRKAGIVRRCRKEPRENIYCALGYARANAQPKARQPTRPKGHSIDTFSFFSSFSILSYKEARAAGFVLFCCFFLGGTVCRGKRRWVRQL